MIKRLWGCLIAVLMFVAILAVPTLGAEGKTLDEALDGIVTYYEDNQTDLNSWEEAVGLSRAGVDLSDEYWQLPDWEIDSLDESSYPVDYASAILGMLAADQDPTNSDGRDLVAELAALQDGSGNFGARIHDTVWSMVALDTADASYDTAGASAYLLDQQTSDGGWAFSGGTADPDMTGFALIALAPHQDEDGVEDAIEAAKGCLQDMQLDSGGFSSGIENTESIAAIIRGLVACDEDITADQWVKNDNTMIDALFAFQLEDNSFAHREGGSSNAMATRQALIAVADMVNAGISYTIGEGSGGGGSDEVTVRVRVEGAADELLDEEVEVAGTALDALLAAAGEDNLTAPGGFVSEILGESGQANTVPGTDTSWFYYVIRDGEIEPNAFNEGPGSYLVEDDDEIVFYIGAFDNSNWAGKTYLPVVSVSPAAPTAGEGLTISISAQKYDWMSGLQDLTDEEKNAIGEYTVKAGGEEYTSVNGQATISSLTEGTLEYEISNANEDGYPDVVTYKGSVEVGEGVTYSIRVRVEGAADELLDEEVEVAGTALDALLAAAGEDNLTAHGGFVSEILGESGQTNVVPGIDTYWFYYVIRDGEIEPNAFNEGPSSYLVEDNDEIVYYVGAYDTSAWANKTYLPVVSVSPAAPTAGESLTISISAQKYDWLSGLQNLTAEETAAIGDYTVTAGGEEYTSVNGQVTISSLTEGTLEYEISNASEDGYPDVVTYQGSIAIRQLSPVLKDFIEVEIAVVGQAGNLLYGPREVKIYETDEYGYTAMGALDATGLSWTVSDTWDGFITEIGGEENEGMSGWMFSVNEETAPDVPMFVDVENGDRIIFWYSTDPMEEGPTWDEILYRSEHPLLYADGIQEAKEIFDRYDEDLDDLGDTTQVWNEDERLTATQVAKLKKSLDANKVDFSVDLDEQEVYVVDSDVVEVAILVPDDAVDGSQTITIRELPAGDLRQQNGINILSSIYEFGPSPLEFYQPVTICIKVAIDESTDLSSLSPAWWDEANQKWTPIPGIIDLQYGLVIFRVDHFSQYALINSVQVQLPPRVTFTDVGADLAWAQDAIELLAGQGIIRGTETCLFEPLRSITRAEFVQLIANARSMSPATELNNVFSDINPGDWYAAAVISAYENKIVAGNPDQTFKPSNIISRNEVAVIFANLNPEGVAGQLTEIPYHDLYSVPVWAFNGVKFAHQRGLMSGYEDGTFRGNNPLTRAEAAVTIFNYLNMNTKS